MSQRYVEVKAGSFLVPDLGGEAQAVYDGTVAMQAAAYRELTAALRPLAQAEYYARFPARSRSAPGKWDKEIDRKAQEIARYVLPVATFSYLYHTVSGITLLRYWRLACQYDAPDEQRLVVGRMIEELLRVDPNYGKLLQEPLPAEETLEAGAPLPSRAEARRFREEFDAELGGAVSILVDWKTGNEPNLARAVREVLGLPAGSLPDAEAIELVLSSARNPYLSETLNLTTLSKLTRALVHPSYTFRKKLSHTADSQDQRHRGTPASRPALALAPPDEPDYIVPALVALDGRILARYREVMERTWEGMNRLLALGVEPWTAVYLLPNAVAIRFSESADLLSLQHKHRMRLCYLAQEEIWRASVEEAEAVRRVNPVIGRYLLPPAPTATSRGSSRSAPRGGATAACRSGTSTSASTAASSEPRDGRPPPRASRSNREPHHPMLPDVRSPIQGVPGRRSLMARRNSVAAPGQRREFARRDLLRALSTAGIASAVFGRAVLALADGGKKKLTASMIEKAEWISGIKLDEKQRKMMLDGVAGSLEGYEKLRAVPLDNSVPPALRLQLARARVGRRRARRRRRRLRAEDSQRCPEASRFRRGPRLPSPPPARGPRAGPPGFLRRADPPLPRPAAPLRPAPAVRHHLHRRARARAGRGGRPRDRGGALPRPPARHPLGREGPPRGARVPDDVGRRPLQGAGPPREGGRRRAAGEGRRRARREDDRRRAGVG